MICIISALFTHTRTQVRERESKGKQQARHKTIYLDVFVLPLSLIFPSENDDDVDMGKDD
jgi:DNA invertase Pin-like site-specific DNA recombinase